MPPAQLALLLCLTSQLPRSTLLRPVRTPPSLLRSFHSCQSSPASWGWLQVLAQNFMLSLMGVHCQAASLNLPLLLISDRWLQIPYG